MNLAETKRLLTMLQRLDGRQPDDATVILWQGILADVEFRDAQPAVIDHKRESTEYLQPAHIVARAREMADNRAQQERLRLDRALIRKPVPGALFGEIREPGLELARYVLAAVRAAGSNPAAGSFIGKKKAGDVAAKAARQWLKAHRTGEALGDPTPESCGRTMCRCTHGLDTTTGARCIGGWIEDDRPNPHPNSHGSVFRCPTCAGERAKILADAPTYEAAGKALRLSKDR